MNVGEPGAASPVGTGGRNELYGDWFEKRLEWTWSERPGGTKN